MTIPFGRMAAAALGALALAAAGAAQAQHSAAVQRVLDRARAASGGAAWTRIAGLHEVGSEAGLRYERWVDLLRYGVRTEVRTPAGTVVRGYNGYGAWSLWPAGADRSGETNPVLAKARTDAFFAAQGYFFPSRFDLRTSYVGARAAEGRRFDVVRIQPAGGEPREVWFDRATGLPGRIVETGGPKPVTVSLSDYRRAGPVLAPYRVTISGGDLDRPVERRLDRAEAPHRVEREMFSLPRPKAP